METQKTKPFKASSLIKKELDITSIYQRIKEENDYGNFKIFIHHNIYFSENQLLEFINNGFKVYKGDWDGVMRDVWIIEW